MNTEGLTRENLSSFQAKIPVKTFETMLEDILPGDGYLTAREADVVWYKSKFSGILPAINKAETEFFLMKDHLTVACTAIANKCSSIRKNPSDLS